jgi:hypothetical protein
MGKTVILRVEEEGRVTQKEISRKAAEASDLIRDMISDDAPDETPEVPLPLVNAKGLLHLADFLERNENDPCPVFEDLVHSNKIDDIKSFPPWARAWVKNLTIDALVDATNAANYVDCAPMLSLCTTFIACQVYNKTPREIWEWAGIPKDAFPTPAEEAEIERQNAWVFDIPQPKTKA